MKYEVAMSYTSYLTIHVEAEDRHEAITMAKDIAREIDREEWDDAVENPEVYELSYEDENGKHTEMIG
jgi:hypothetical protein